MISFYYGIVAHKEEISMHITRLRLNQYRNYEALDMRPRPGANVIVGDNAQGKTNAIEGIFLCAFGRSHRTAKDGELIKQGCEGGYVGADIHTRMGDRRIEIRFREGERKRILLDQKPAARVGELMGALNVVMFSPEDLSLVKGGPAERRRFLDMELSQSYPAYFYQLQQYNAALRQRNALLKAGPAQCRPAALSIWDAQLAALGARIIMQRRRFIEKLARLALSMHLEVSGGRERLDIRYMPGFETADFENLEEKLLGALSKGALEDIARGFTRLGPHRDDMAVRLSDMDLRTFGSQGQQRTAALSLKLSQLSLLKEETGEAPVLLLDDVLSELDQSRQRLLLKSVEGCQCFLTCTSLDGLEKAGFSDMAIWRAEAGQLL